MASAMIVTAAQGGTGTDNGIVLTVKVVTGALPAAVQDGATGNSSTLTVPQQAVTPAGTGSWIYGAVTNVAAATAFTANASTTFSQNVLYAGDGDTFGTFRSAGTTTASTPVTVGASAPTEATTNLIWAAAEILVFRPVPSTLCSAGSSDPFDRPAAPPSISRFSFEHSIYRYWY